MAISSADHGAPNLKVKLTAFDNIELHLEIYLEFQVDKVQPELMGKPSFCRPLKIADPLFLESCRLLENK